ncbi:MULTISPECIES: hypothetical protein [Pacificimonas]|uniref:Uncharacterized protein n=1 Tax=Pacificimonas aurantium TaxID=1250540 RepID=A0ABS7WN89_9SPHN|nr:MULTISPECIES: hypothetical protein [Pacificimonas]MBZ6379876.1 hypothetical protein [Pacificimonas aurantium]
MSTALQSAQLLPYEVGYRPHVIQFLTLSERDYLDQPFLDQRLLHGGQRQSYVIPLENLPAESFALAKDPAVIFHLGHVGSTLVSRLLAEADAVLPIREPQSLRTLATTALDRAAPHSLISEDGHRQTIRAAVRLLGRPLGQRTQPIVKATSFTSLMATEIARETAAPIAGLVTKAATYLATIFGGDASRSETVNLSPLRRRALACHLPDERFALSDLSDGELVAMSWLSGMLDLAGLKEAEGKRVLLLDFSAFLEAPAQGLSRLSDHLGLSFPQEAQRAALAGPIMSRYSKAQDHEYSPALRNQVLEQARAAHGDEIGRGLKWLEQLGGRHEAVRRAIELAGL